MPHDLSAFKDSVGASSPVATEVVTAGPVARLAATFGIDTPASKPGDVLPPGWADLYFGSLHRPEQHARRRAGGEEQLDAEPSRSASSASAATARSFPAMSGSATS